MPESHDGAALNLCFGRRIMKSFARVRNHRIAQNAQLASLAIHLELNGGSARCPVVHAAESGILLNRFGIVVAYALENRIASESAKYFNQRKPVLRPIEEPV